MLEPRSRHRKFGRRNFLLRPHILPDRQRGSKYRRKRFPVLERLVKIYFYLYIYFLSNIVHIIKFQKMNRALVGGNRPGKLKKTVSCTLRV